MNGRKAISSAKLATLERLCRQHRLPLTTQRRVIMENLAIRTDHPTADQVYASVRDRLPGVSRTTVYRVLEVFLGLGIIRKINDPEARARFDADTARHHHLHCVLCGRVDDVRDPVLDRLPLPDCSTSGFEIRDYSIDYAGICADCRAASGAPPAREEKGP